MRLVFSRCALTQRHLTWELKQNTCEPCNASTLYGGACLSIRVRRVLFNNSMHDEVSLPIMLSLISTTSLLNASISILRRNRLTVYFNVISNATVSIIINAIKILRKIEERLCLCSNEKIKRFST